MAFGKVWSWYLSAKKNWQVCLSTTVERCGVQHSHTKKLSQRIHRIPHSHNNRWGWSRKIANKPATPALLDPLKNTPVTSQQLGQHAPHMADGLGDSRNGDARPMGPKWNLLKQTTQVKAREYYNSEIPRVGSHKQKTPSWSPSMEPTEHIQPTADWSITYASITRTPSPQDQNAVNPKRPTTLTMNNTPATETTLCTMWTTHCSPHEADEEDVYMEPLSITEATAAAARAKLDYVKINDHLNNILHNINDILEQQVSDIFQLSSWVASIVTMFGLRVCDEKEWHHFNKHYDQETGEVTSAIPSELTYAPYDTPMTEVAREELSHCRWDNGPISELPTETELTARACH